MKKHSKVAVNKGRKSSAPLVSEKYGEEGVVEILGVAKSSEKVTLEERKKEARKPIYLVRV